VIDIDAILAPIPGDNPAGEDLRYSPTYDEIKEARREDDQLDRGDWARDIKTSDWDKVITISVEALTQKTKDLQIAAWLCEALTRTEHFEGLLTGLKIVNGLLSNFWDHLYPEIEEGDLEFRVGPIEYLNNNLGSRIKQVPITDSKAAPGYSWFQWQESREVGREEDTHNQYGDVDEEKKKKRDELIAEGKLKAEDFEAAVLRSPVTYYESLGKKMALCQEAFQTLDEVVEKRFGQQDAPNLQELRKTLEDLNLFMRSEKIREKLKVNEQPEQAPEPESRHEEQTDNGGGAPMKQDIAEPAASDAAPRPPTAPPVSAEPYRPKGLSDSVPLEAALWENALNTLNTSGVGNALGQLYGASCSAPSERERNHYRLLMAKLCLKAERPDLARPIVEQLYTLIEELNLERWEAPVWIGEVLDTLYQCLTTGEPSDDDTQRAKGLLQKLCTIDVTKAMIYGH
jgi:type VI secretion system protein ImpA